MSRLKLTRSQRAALFDGATPRITGEGECPVGPGYSLRLSSRVELKVLNVEKAKVSKLQEHGTVNFVAGWKLRYELRDRRDPTEFLRRTPTVHVNEWTFDEHGYPKEPTEDVVSDAAHDSAYTWRRDSMDAGSVIDPDTQRRYSAQAKEQNKLRRAEEHDKAEAKRLTQKLRDLKAQARRKSVDISPEIRAVADALDEAEKRISNGGEQAA